MPEGQGKLSVIELLRCQLSLVWSPNTRAVPSTWWRLPISPFVDLEVEAAHWLFTNSRNTCESWSWPRFAGQRSSSQLSLPRSLINPQPQTAQKDLTRIVHRFEPFRHLERWWFSRGHQCSTSDMFGSFHSQTSCIAYDRPCLILSCEQNWKDGDDQINHPLSCATSNWSRNSGWESFPPSVFLDFFVRASFPALTGDLGGLTFPSIWQTPIMVKTNMNG